MGRRDVAPSSGKPNHMSIPTKPNTFVLTINCENDAFQPDPTMELERLLRDIADRIAMGDVISTYRTIYDANGNDVGRFKLIGARGD
jgi:hypothetical protein